MQIDKRTHWLSPTDAKSKASPNKGGKITPRVIVMHYTATWTDKAAVNTLTDPTASASAHVVVGRDGAITQLVPFNTEAWHAGPSQWGSYRGLNKHSIGIEIVNIGYVRHTTHGYIDPYGKVFKHADIEKMGLIGFQDTRLGPGAFYPPLYPESQLLAVDGIVGTLLRAYPSIEAIVTHREIDTRGWKVDPGPAFPMMRYTQMLNNRKVSKVVTKTAKRTGIVAAEALNVRINAASDADLASWGPVAEGVKLHILDEKPDWFRVSTLDGLKTGWVRSKYIQE